MVRSRRFGRRLYVHADTVRYRTRRVEQLTGRSLVGPQVVLDLGAAYRHCPPSTVPTVRADRPRVGGAEPGYFPWKGAPTVVKYCTAAPIATGAVTRI
ncbi:helix-turn-helix domain-containing protein [Nocardia sp. CA-107356]|uniref:helix-turn-helix domain-containing protein n=1 Tax=Nocardia sp. CA-107356 TaxID=3239972 RepID=UPI003D8DD998